MPNPSHASVTIVAIEASNENRPTGISCGSWLRSESTIEFLGEVYRGRNVFLQISNRGVGGEEGPLHNTVTWMAPEDALMLARNLHEQAIYAMEERRELE